MVYEYLMDNFPNRIFIILYVLNLIFGIIAYKLGFARKLPLGKSIFVYIMLAIGVFILTLFNILGPIMGGMVAPVTEVLVITSLVLGIYRYRLHRSRQAKK